MHALRAILYHAQHVGNSLELITKFFEQTRVGISTPGIPFIHF